MVTSSDYNVFGIHNPAERYSWSAYHLLALLSSLIGDTIILYASFKRRDAFKINKSLVVIIQHIAISDLALASSCAFPRAASLLANSWVLGDALCYAKVYVTYLTYPTGTFFVLTLTLSKFLLLKYPLWISVWTRKKAQQLCICIWTLCSAVLVTFLALGKDDVLFDYRVYECDYGFRAEAWKIMIPILTILFQFIPSIIIIGATIPILMHLVTAMKLAKRLRRKVPWQGTFTVTITAAVYCISNLPLSAYFISMSDIQKDPSNMISIRYCRVSYFLVMLNVVANFYIYTLTIRSFRRFLLSYIPLLSSRTTRRAGKISHLK
jgi:hypothetical protein